MNGARGASIPGMCAHLILFATVIHAVAHVVSVWLPLDMPLNRPTPVRYLDGTRCNFAPTPVGTCGDEPFATQAIAAQHWCSLDRTLSFCLRKHINLRHATQLAPLRGACLPEGNTPIPATCHFSQKWYRHFEATLLVSASAVLAHVLRGSSQ